MDDACPPRRGPGPNERRWSAGDTLWLAVALGCLFGLGEVVSLGVRRFVMGRLTNMTPHVVWMAPFAYTILFLLLVPLFLGLRRLSGPFRSVYPALVTFLALGLIGWIAMLPWPLHGGAIVIVAVAVADRLSRAGARRPARLRVAARGVGAGFLVVVSLSGGLLVAQEVRTERRALAALPAADAGAPNVLLLVLDTVRAQSMSVYGASRRTTPTLDSLARESTVFDWAIAPAPWTLPSHASMFTGMWPHELSLGWLAPLDDSPRTLAEALAAHGYVTAGFVANLVYTSRVFGLDRGFARYEDFPVSPGQILLAASLGRAIVTADSWRRWLDWHELPHRKSAAAVRKDFLTWLDRAPRRPYFAFLNFFDAHEPYLPPEPYHGMFAPGSRRRPIAHVHSLERGLLAGRVSPWATPRDEIPRDLAIYEETIAYLDSEIGRLLRALRNRGELDRTLLIVTSDHGEEFGEKGTFEHGSSLFIPAIRVPLLLRLPGVVPAGHRVTDPVTLRDIPATVLDLLGVSSETEPFPSRTLRRTWEEGRLASIGLSHLEPGLVRQPWYPIARGSAMASLVRWGQQYVCNPDGTEELYDLQSDPEDSVNRLEHNPGASAVAPFRRILRRIGVPPPECPPAPGTAPRPGRIRPPEIGSASGR